MTIQELADEADVTIRTIRYYVEQGVLPPPGHGRPAEYTQEHVALLALIKQLKAQYLPLEEIRDTLQRLSIEEVAQLVAEYSPPPRTAAPQANSAADYISNVLGRGEVREQLKRRYTPPGAAPGATPDAKSESGGSHLAEEAPLPYQPPADAPAPQPRALPAMPPLPSRARATSETAAAYIPSPQQEEVEEAPAEPSPTAWERVELGEGVELHYPAAVDAGTKKKVARLIDAARHILGRGPGNGE